MCRARGESDDDEGEGCLLGVIAAAAVAVVLGVAGGLWVWWRAVAG